jgi:hypothetical protein
MDPSGTIIRGTTGFKLKSGSGGSTYGSSGIFSRGYYALSEWLNGVSLWYSGAQTRATLGVHDGDPSGSLKAGIEVLSLGSDTIPYCDLSNVRHIKAAPGGITIDLFNYSPQDVEGTDLPSGGIQFVGPSGWAIPAPVQGARLLVAGADNLGAPVTNTLSITNSGATVRGISHNGVSFSEAVSLDMIGRCIELVGISSTVWRIVGTAPWTR